MSRKPLIKGTVFHWFQAAVWIHQLKLLNRLDFKNAPAGLEVEGTHRSRLQPVGPAAARTQHPGETRHLCTNQFN
ncbi:hypothetical protein ILYODFUR_031547 [Ilyodon furcidens]|uniref:Uncharacterized protein n=1 Tax=Ilyodon furcidens TaxID=33524 RepID=A0ABV0UNN3_9TELE